MPDWRSLIHARLRSASAGQPELIEDVIDEVSQHLEDLYQSMRASGRSDEDSLAAVEAQLEHLPALARGARIRRSRRLPAAPEPARGRAQLLSAFVRDLRHALRLLASRPGFTAAAILTLALGIGANTAIFSVVHSLLLAPLPFPDSDRLVFVWESALDDREDQNIVSAPNWQSWRDGSTSFEHIGLWEALSFNVSGGQEPEQVAGMRVSASAFPMLGIAPRIGRTFSEAENERGHHVVVISDSLWRRRFEANPSIVGQTIRVNGDPHEVIGVMPPDFLFVDRRTHVWVPIALNDEDGRRDSHSFLAAGRLKKGVSFEDARNEVEALGRRMEAQHHEGHGATITPFADFGVRYLRPTLSALLGAVGFVLLIACVNVANLLLAQASVRQREFTIRKALGATRGRIARQLLAEGMLLALAGGAVGVGIAWAGTAALGQSLPAGIANAPFRTVVVVLHGPVLAFTCAIAIAAGLLFSLAPLAGLNRTDASAALKAAGVRGGTSRSTHLRAALVGMEVALAVVVLAAAGLMLKSVDRLMRVDAGVDPRNVLVMRVALPQPDFYGPPVRTTFCEDLQREVGSLPGVLSVGAMSQMPLEGWGATRGFNIEGRPEPNQNELPVGRYRLVCPGYFPSLGIAVRQGREFTAGDTLTSQPVAIISESMARRHWPNQDPIGARIQLSVRQPWVTIVGVVSDVRQLGLDTEIPRMLYRPYSQAAWPAMNVTVKTAGEPLAMAATVQRALRRIDPDQPVSRTRTMETIVADSIGGRRFPMQLLGLFSIVALVLAAIGVYGVVSYIVSQRAREIGIRVALGAQRGQVTHQIVRGSLVPIGAGIAAGVVGALFASRLLEGLLYEVRPTDPIVLGSIAMMLGGAAMLASWIPARRAAGVDPIAVLRQE